MFDKNSDSLCGECPFCNSKSGMVVSAKRNLYRCKDCKKSGDPICYMMEKHGVSFRGAVSALFHVDGVPGFSK